MAITLVQSSDTPNEGRTKWNANDTDLQGQIDDASSALDTHKGSADHDSRYYTKTDIDGDLAAIDGNIADLTSGKVNNTGSETIAGAKTFSDDLAVKKATPAIQVSNAAGDSAMRMMEFEFSGNKLVALQAYNGSTWEYLLTAYQGDSKLILGRKAYIQDGDSQLQLATQKYVQDRVKTGLLLLTGSLTVPSVAFSTNYPFKNHNGDKLRFVIPQSCVIKQISLVRTALGGSGVDTDADVGWTFNNVGPGSASPRILIPYIQVESEIPTNKALWTLQLYQALVSGSGGEDFIESFAIDTDTVDGASEHVFEISILLAV